MDVIVDGRTKRGERVLDARAIDCVNAMRKRVPEIGTAESTIRTALLAEDLVAYRNKKRIAIDDLTPEELSLLRYSMPEMCGAAIGYIHDVGVVPIAIEEGAFPYVPSAELGRITVYVENGRKRYRWWKRREQRQIRGSTKRNRMETDTFNALVSQLHLDVAADDDGTNAASLAGFDPDPSVVVLSGFGYDPCADGTIESVLVSLIHVYAEKTMRDYLDNEAAKGLAKPVLWYARPDALSAGGTINSNEPIDLNVPENMFVNTDASSANMNDRIAQNEQELAQLNQHIEQFLRVEKERANQTKASAKRVTRIRLAEELLDALRRLLPLPTGVVFASGVPQPRLSGEQKLRDDQFKEQVLTVLNVPLELINPMATHRAGVEEVTNRFRSTTLRQWQRWLERILTFAYRMSFRTQSEETILGKIDPEAMGAHENQLLKTCNEHCVTIGFVIEERASYDQLKELAYLRVLDQKHYAEHVCRILHIDPRDLSDKNTSEKDFYAKLDTLFAKPVAAGDKKTVAASPAASETKSKEVTASLQK